MAQAFVLRRQSQTVCYAKHKHGASEGESAQWLPRPRGSRKYDLSKGRTFADEYRPFHNIMKNVPILCFMHVVCQRALALRLMRVFPT